MELEQKNHDLINKGTNTDRKDIKSEKKFIKLSSALKKNMQRRKNSKKD